MNFKTQWLQFTEVFDNQTTAKRLLILVIALAAIGLIWFYVFAAPVNATRVHLEQRFASAKAALAQISAKERDYVAAFNNDSSAAKKRELQSLKAKLDSLDSELQSLSVGLLPAQLLPQVLHDVLEKSASLALLSLTKGRAEELLLRDVEAAGIDLTLDNVAANAVADLSSDSVRIFKHSVVIKLEGSYFQVRDFLDNMESLPWQFYWQSLDYRVLQHPRALVTLEFYTLSTEKGFLGG